MKKLVATMVVAPLLAVGGCATKGDLDALRAEVASVRTLAQSADQKATAAQASSQQAAADAARAANDAQVAGEKADRIFRSGLKK